MFKKIISFTLWAGLLVTGLSGGAVAALYYNTLESLPNVQQLKEVTFETPMKIYTKDEKLIGEFGENKRIPVPLEEIPLKLQQAFLAIEDSRFYEHTGIDPIGIARAVVVAIANQGATQGASTITQQVARNFFLSRDKTIERKIKEIFISWRIEQVLTKEEILELYLNKIALGHRSNGVVAAAQTYYGKELKDLTLGQMATIAGLPKAPSTLNPISYPERSKNRRHLVLMRMKNLGFITQEEFESADKEPYVAYFHSTPIESYAPYIAEDARQFVIDKFGEEAYTQGFRVITTVNSKIQDDASYAVFKGLTDYDARHGYRGSSLNVTKLDNFTADAPSLDKLLRRYDRYHFIEPAVVTSVDDESKSFTIYTLNGQQTLDMKAIQWARAYKSNIRQGANPKVPSEVIIPGDLIYTYVNEKNETIMTQVPEVEGALVALNPLTGAIEAMVGGYDFYKSKLNRTVQAVRQTGSNFKPFLYSAAVAKGIAVNSVLYDEPIKTWDPGSHTWWQPKNTPNRYDGPMTLREGLAKSKNVVSIRLIRQVGVDNVALHLKKFGIDVPTSQISESMSLGSVELSPLQTATGFAAFANGGYRLEPYFIEKIYRGDELVYEAKAKRADPTAPDRVINDLPLVYKDHIEADESMATQILSHDHAYIMADLLRSVIYGGEGINGPYYGTGGRASRISGRDDLSGKTGTTNKVHDAWFSGFNANLVATAWVGFDDDRNLGYAQNISPEGGAYTALPIFAEFIKRAQEGVPSSRPARPATIKYTTNAGITDLATTNTYVIAEDGGNSVLNVQNTGTDTSDVDSSDIF